ncbi:MAG: hypothetical protein ACSHXK_09255 [Oceanococcus sp.]
MKASSHKSQIRVSQTLYREHRGIHYKFYTLLVAAFILSACGNYAGVAQSAPAASEQPPSESSESGTAAGSNFEQRVQPLLDYCRTCHVPEGVADTEEGWRFMLNEDASDDYDSFYLSWDRMGGNNPLSRILVMSSGGESHSGGEPWVEGGQPYADVERQLDCFERGSSCEASSEPASLRFSSVLQR